MHEKKTHKLLQTLYFPFQMCTIEPKNILDLPNEIYIHIYKLLPMKSMHSLAQINKRFYSVYHTLNSNYTDKVSFNTKYDCIDEYENNMQLKEVIFNFLQIERSYEDIIKFCLKRSHLEKIKIRGVTNDIFENANVPYGYLKNLTHIEINVLIHSDKPVDYLLPLVTCSHVLESIIIENIILTRAAMMEISLSKNLKCFKLLNISIFNISAFRMLLYKMENIKEFLYIYHYFIRMTPVIKTLEAMVEIIPLWDKVKKLKISAWQAISPETMRETRLYEKFHHNFKLNKGTSLSFFSALLPLLSIKPAEQLEIFYSNQILPDKSGERASIQYTIIDSPGNNTKAYRYTTI